MAKSKNALPKRMFKGAERASSYLHDRSQTARIKKLSRQHEDVLQDIEAVLVYGEREYPEIDDQVASLALRARIANIAPEDHLAERLFNELAAVRDRHDTISDFEWIEALRVVHESVVRHSSRTPGEKHYLRFAARFVGE